MNSMFATERKADSRLGGSAIFLVPQKRRLILCLLLVLATLALYNSVTHAPFLNYDDQVYVTDNLQVRAGLTWKTVGWAFRSSEQSNWHPITWLSHAFDCQVFGLNPEGPHTVNVLLHATNVVLLFLILESATGFAWRSLIVAAFFALHPINVESVAWVSERKNVLSMLFFLVALAAYGWYARRPGAGRYLAVTFTYALGLMTKPQVITFPFALLLLDYWPLYRLGHVGHVAAQNGIGEGSGTETAVDGPSLWQLVWEKTPWFAMSAASAAITMKVQTNAAEVNLPLWIHLGNAAIAYVKYVGKAFWPVDLAPLYFHPQLSISLPAAALSTIVIIAVSGVAVIYRERRPYFVGWFWFLGTLVPMIGVVQVGVQAMADRYAYIPLLGIFVIVTWGAADLIKQWRVPMAVPVAVTAAVLLTMGVALHRQAGFWSDNVKLWTHTLEVTGPNYMVEDNLASALLVEGRDEEGFPHLLRARALRPDDPGATLNIANYQRLHGHYQEALEGYARVLQLSTAPSSVETALVDSGYAHLALKQYDNARRDFESARKQETVDPVVYRALGLLAQKAGDIGQAAQNYERSVEVDPTPVGYLLLAQALEISGQRNAALAARAEAGRRSRDISRDMAIVKQLLSI
jgi:hypothetical protein